MKEFSYGIAPYKVIRGKMFLLVSKSSMKSKYGFIKGKIEENETIEDCSIRECKEETNLTIKKEYLEEYFFQTNKKKNIGIFLYPLEYLSFKENKLSPELFSLSLKELNQDLFNSFELNQKKIINQISLYSKNHLKNIIIRDYFF